MINNRGNEMAGDTKTGGVWRKNPWGMAAWSAAALLLLLPLVAMQFTDEVVWDLTDFIFAGVLLFSSVGAYEIAARKTSKTVYRAGVGLGIAATFLLIWGNAAVYITDSAADLIYFGVAVIGIIGVIIALFRPARGAPAMLATAFGLVVACVISLVTGMVPNYYASAFEVIGVTSFYIALYVGAAWFLWEAAREHLPPS